jgi:hypothetical protein
MWEKNYILSEENGNKVLTKKFPDYKFFGWFIFIVFSAMGIYLMVVEDYTIFGGILTGLGLLFFILTISLKMKMTEHKDEFLIEKVYPLWIKKKFNLNKKEKPIILGIKESPSLYDGVAGPYEGGNRLYTLKVSYNKNMINLYYSIDFMSFRSAMDWSIPEQIKEVADFFKLPYKLIN